MRNFQLFITFIIAATLVGGCANKVAPTGGMKDVTPPNLLKATPPDNTVNFASDKVTLTFDEYVQLKDAAKQVVVSPPVSPAPRITAVKKSIIVEFDSLPAPNTTYNINFGNAVADNNEGNPLPGFRYTFSTGPFIDSLTVKGKIIDALTLKPADGALAILYRADLPDSLLLKSLPNYFSRTSIDGSYIITNVAAGVYRLFALAEKNPNYLLDQPDEKAGFLSETVIVPDTSMHELRVFTPLPVKQTLKGCNVGEHGKITMSFGRPAADISWDFIGTAGEVTAALYSDKRDSLTLHMRQGVSDTLRLKVFENSILIDTLLCRTTPSAQAKLQPKFTGYALNPITNSMLQPEKNPVVRWSSPIVSFDSTKVKVTTRDSVAVAATFRFADSLQTHLEINAAWKEPGHYITIAPGAVKDIYGLENDTVKWMFTIPAERTKGSISFKVGSKTAGHQILQLVNDKDEIIRERFFENAVEGIFERLEPGTYRMRLVSDSNNNRKWDTGDHLKKQQPEHVVYFKDSIMVRANWEVEVTNFE